MPLRAVSASVIRLSMSPLVLEELIENSEIDALTVPLPSRSRMPVPPANSRSSADEV